MRYPHYMYLYGGAHDQVHRFPDDVAYGGTPSGTDVTLWNLPYRSSYTLTAIVTYQGDNVIVTA